MKIGTEHPSRKRIIRRNPEPRSIESRKREKLRGVMKSVRKQKKYMKRRVVSPRAPDSLTSIGSAENRELILQMIKR